VIALHVNKEPEVSDDIWIICVALQTCYEYVAAACPSLTFSRTELVSYEAQTECAEMPIREFVSE
jgi:hypothetical protein